jgi:hypothetical protein
MARLSFPYDYASCVKNSERVSWKLDDVILEGARLDLTKKLLPSALSAKPILCLNDAEQLLLNQLGGNAYLNLFAFVEEFILATVVQHASAELFGDHTAIRALARFADEEVKHQELFHRYRRSFNASFGHPAEVLETAATVADVVLSKSPIGVMLIILHIELMTLDHYSESVRDDATIDPLFRLLLEKHWVEESQHARIDALELAKLVNVATDEQISTGLKEYVELLHAFEGLLTEQSMMDLKTLSTKLGRSFSEEEKHAIVDAQLCAYRRTFLVAGIRSPKFKETVSVINAAAAADIASLGDRWAA